MTHYTSNRSEYGIYLHRSIYVRRQNIYIYMGVWQRNKIILYLYKNS